MIFNLKTSIRMLSNLGPFLMVTFFIGLSIIPSNLSAQTEKKRIGILQPTTSTHSTYRDAIWQTVTDAFIKTKRFDVLERARMEDISKEIKFQSDGGNSLDFEATVEQDKIKGAEYLIAPHINFISTEEMVYIDEKTGRKGSNGYKAKISVTLKVIDITTGKVKISETLELKEGNLFKSMIKKHNTQTSAIEDGIKKISKEVDKFVSKHFPVTLTVVEITTEKKVQASIILIGGGSDSGIKKGDKVIIFEKEMKEVNGKMLERTKEIGSGKIKKVEDANFSVCKVSKGGQAIKQKLDGGNTLFIKIN
jgi:hypothetical protein